MAVGKVKVWYMTEEERQEYIKKHPIVPMKKVKKKGEEAFSNIHTDYKWRGKKVAESRKVEVVSEC